MPTEFRGVATAAPAPGPTEKKGRQQQQQPNKEGGDVAVISKTRGGKDGGAPLEWAEVLQEDLECILTVGEKCISA